MRAWLGGVVAASLWLATGAAADDGFAGAHDWFSDHVQIHGFVTSNLYTRTPDFQSGSDIRVSSWRNELDVETDVRLYEEGKWRLGFYGVFRPVYDAVYELNPTVWGDRASGGTFDPLTFGAVTAPDAAAGRGFPGMGACVKIEFCLGNGHVGTLFSSNLEPSLVLDDVLFFGATTAPWLPRSGWNVIGGNASGSTYYQYLTSPLRSVAAQARLTEVLARSGLPTALAPTFTALGTTGLTASLAKASLPLTMPLNFNHGALGSAKTFTQAPFDLNRTEDQLKFDCTDNAHPWCFVREAFFQADYDRTSLRVGRQQIVWGKTDAFRLQDIVDPIDVGYHNVIPDLEERRIPMLSLDVLQGLGDVGPLMDTSVEFAWVFDRFLPAQFGQCGEPYAFAIACQGRADAAAHQLFDFALARVEPVPWTFENTEPGARVEFRIPKPSMSFSFSLFYGRQDLPVAEFTNHYSVANPNPAAMLFLQGQGAGPLIEALAGGLGAVGTTAWSTGFDPYNTRPGSELQSANAVLNQAWINAFTSVPPPTGCAGLTGAFLAVCADQLASLALPWTASEAVIKYPRVLTFGGSADYEIPNSDAVVRSEFSFDFGRGVNNTAKYSGADKSDVFMGAIGIDRPTFIPFINPNRTALLSAQLFVEHFLNYDGGGRTRSGMVVPETDYITTFLMENYWRNDSLVLRNFLAYDFYAEALIYGPSFKWIINNNLFAQVGLNVFFGDARRPHNIRDLCAGGGLGCLANPSAWQAGQWQTLNRFLIPETQAPWWSRQGFADRFMSRRDEVWMGLTYQF
jgi:Protein of unknown function (DUF1302)